MILNIDTEYMKILSKKYFKLKNILDHTITSITSLRNSSRLVIFDIVKYFCNWFQALFIPSELILSISWNSDTICQKKRQKTIKYDICKRNPNILSGVMINSFFWKREKNYKKHWRQVKQFLQIRKINTHTIFLYKVD